MRKSVWFFIVVASAVIPALSFFGCGGGGGSSDGGGGGSTILVTYAGKTTAADITPAVVTSALTNTNGYVPICTASGVATSKAADVQDVLAAFAPIGIAAKLVASPILAARSVPNFQPPDIAGSCGGFLRFKNWNHANGTTAGTLSFDNFCATMRTTGDKSTMSGDIAFNAPGTPGDFGPVTSQVTASAPKITMSTTSSSGSLKQNTSVGFEGFVFTPGTPTSGTAPSNTQGRADTYAVTRIVIGNETTNKQTKVENATITMLGTAGGGVQETITGRLFIFDSGYVDVTTDLANPILINSSGVHTAGRIINTGNAGSQAVLTIVPGNPHSPSVTFTVNGTAMSGVKLDCYNPLTLR